MSIKVKMLFKDKKEEQNLVSNDLCGIVNKKINGKIQHSVVVNEDILRKLKEQNFNHRFI